MIVACNDTEDTWYLSCRQNRWVGHYDNCTAAAAHHNCTLVGTSRMLCAAGSMRLSGVRPSVCPPVCPSMGPQPQQLFGLVSLKCRLKCKGSPYSIAERRVPGLISVLCSQPAGDVSHKPGGKLPLLSARPAVTPATLKRAAANFAAW